MNTITKPHLVQKNYDGVKFPYGFNKSLLSVMEHQHGVSHANYQRTGLTHDGKPVSLETACVLDEVIIDGILCPIHDCPLKQKGVERLGEWYRSPHTGLNGEYMTFTWIEMLMHFHYFHPKIAKCQHGNAELKSEVRNGTWFNQWTHCNNCGMDLHCAEARSNDTWD